MLDQVKEKINQGFTQRAIAFVLLYAFFYTLVWNMAEPLNLEIITSNTAKWRFFLIGGCFVLTLLFFFVFLFTKNLERFSLDYSDTSLQSNYSSPGLPSITTTEDGHHKRIFVIKADYDKDDMTWDLKATTHNATIVTFMYLPEGSMTFYLRVSVIQSDRSRTEYKWLRYEPTFSGPQTQNDNEEMGVPIKVITNHTFNEATSNIEKTVKLAFGKFGWQLDKVLRLRIRGSGKIKSITFK